MKFTFSLLALASTTLAHNIVTHFHINGVADKSCVRQASSTSPITDIQSDAMACNTVRSPASNKCVVQAGDAIGFEWRTDPNVAPADYPLKDGSIPVGVTDDSHKGPCAIYMKKVTDSSNADGVGDGWFKVSEDGLDADGVFCTDRIREANAPQPGVVPANIEPGDYLLRAEMLTLNNAGPASMGGEEQPQFYVGCVQVTVEGTSGTNPDTVSIPGYLTMASPGLIFDIWNSPNGKYSDYTVPGPAPMAGGSSGSSGSSSPSTSAAETKPTSVYAAPTADAPADETTVAGTNPTTAPSTPDNEGEEEEAPTSTKTTVRATTAPDAAPTTTRTRGRYTVTTATTLITITSTTSAVPAPEQTGSDDSEDSGEEPAPTRTRGNGYGHGHHGRHRYRAHRAV